MEPYEVGSLAVGGNHTLYWAQHGTPGGIPVVLLHGGPGSGSSSLLPRLFDPKAFRIVSFDQRGCGRSKPLGSLCENDLNQLVEDTEALKRHLNIERWLVCGGSWGSTLGLSYGARYPSSCLGFLLRGIFLCTEKELHWWLYGMRAVYPEHWEKFANLVPRNQRSDLLAGYGRLLNNPETALEAANAWKSYERSCSSFAQLPNVDQSSAEAIIAAARIHHHYFSHSFFAGDESLLAGVTRINHLPAIVVHGRDDMVCPVANAVNLAARWGRENAALDILNEAGHTLREPAMMQAMAAAATRMLKRLNT